MPLGMHDSLDMPAGTSSSMDTESSNGVVSPPTQPSSGPGGSDYPHAGFRRTFCGQDERAFWIFEPHAPRPNQAPLVCFFHAWGGTNPHIYGNWIVHLVRKGHMVLYPVYQTLSSILNVMEHNALVSFSEAIGHVSKGPFVTPDLERLAIVGHSLGGWLGLRTAALAFKAGILTPKALMIVQPGWGPFGRISMEELRHIPSTTLMLFIVGEHDRHCLPWQATRLYRAVELTPGINKDFVRMFSDFHGTPPLICDHSSPLAVRDDCGPSLSASEKGLRTRMLKVLSLRWAKVDALHYYGYWKLFDALQDAAFYGKNRKYALGNTPQQRFMGYWSDGIPVKELRVTQDPI